jgi:hypothetical protein
VARLDSVYLVDDIYLWINWLIFVGEAILWVWALADCVSRKAPAFPAVNRLTKGAWLAITLTAVLLGFLGSGALYGGYPSAIGILPLIAVVAAMVYLADVRPAVREVSGGNRP